MASRTGHLSVRPFRFPQACARYFGIDTASILRAPILCWTGRLLPRDIRRHGEKIVEAVSLQGSPKLARMVDEKSTVSAYDAIEKYLSGIDAWDRRKGNALGFLTTNAFNLLVVMALLIIVLRWRGFI